MREHLESVERQIGKKPKELEDLILLPETLKEYWYWFLSLNATRSSGFGMSPITYTEMWSFFSLKNIEPSEQEIDIIKMFDHVAMDHSAKLNKNKEK